MASTYVNDLRLNEMATGDASGTWGDTTNTNLELIGEALGFGTEAITTNADTHTSTVADGATDPVRAMYVKYTGTLDSACTITIAPNTISRMQFIENATSGSQNIIISQGSGANVTIPAGDVKAVYLDGAGSGAAVTDAFASLNVVDLKVEDDLTVTDDLIVNGDIDLEGSIDVNGTANLDVVDIDGAVDMASTLQVDGAITSSSAATITVADNSYTLTLLSTDTDANSGPNIRLKRDSSSPADDDFTGIIYFQAENDAGEETDYQRITTRIRDASDGSEDGQLTFSSMVAGTLRNRLEFNEGEAVFNDDSVDVNFRVESNGNANTLFVNGGKDYVSIGTASDFAAGASVLHLHQPDANSNAYLHITQEDGGATSSDGMSIGVLDGGANAVIRLRENGFLAFYTNNTEHMRLSSGGSLVIHDDTPLTNTTFDARDVDNVTSLNVQNNGAVIQRSQSATAAPTLNFFKARGSLGSEQNINTGDFTGSILFRGYHTNGFYQTASIESKSIQAAGTNDMPGSLIFSTTPDGSVTPTSKLEIADTGVTSLKGGTTSGIQVLEFTNGSITIADDASIGIINPNVGMMLSVSSLKGVGGNSFPAALFFTTNDSTVTVIADPESQYSNTPNTDNKINVYTESGTVRLQNKIGAGSNFAIACFDFKGV
tara:strand:- start:1274 stop:3253 length:1980 start_codon:yes stop_codon:yes gene_type:complete